LEGTVTLNLLLAQRERTQELRHVTDITIDPREVYGLHMNSPIRGFLTSFRVQAQFQGDPTGFRVQVPLGHIITIA
jgi:hypothetical protein